MAEKPFLPLIFVIAMLSIISSVFAIDDKCSACTAIAVSNQFLLFFFFCQFFSLILVLFAN